MWSLRARPSRGDCPAVPLPPGAGCLVSAAWELLNVGLRLLDRQGIVPSDGWEGGGGGGAGLLIGACGDLLDPCKWGHSSVGVLCPPPSHLASFVMRALRSPELPRRQDLTSEPFRAPASVSAPQAEKPSSPPG